MKINLPIAIRQKNKWLIDIAQIVIQELASTDAPECIRVSQPDNQEISLRSYRGHLLKEIHIPWYQTEKLHLPNDAAAIARYLEQHNSVDKLNNPLLPFIAGETPISRSRFESGKFDVWATPAGKCIQEMHKHTFIIDGKLYRTTRGPALIWSNYKNKCELKIPGHGIWQNLYAFGLDEEYRAHEWSRQRKGQYDPIRVELWDHHEEPFDVRSAAVEASLHMFHSEMHRSSHVEMTIEQVDVFRRIRDRIISENYALWGSHDTEWEYFDHQADFILDQEALELFNSLKKIPMDAWRKNIVDNIHTRIEAIRPTIKNSGAIEKLAGLSI